MVRIAMARRDGELELQIWRDYLFRQHKRLVFIASVVGGQRVMWLILLGICIYLCVNALKNDSKSHNAYIYRY